MNHLVLSLSGIHFIHSCFAFLKGYELTTYIPYFLVLSFLIGYNQSIHAQNAPPIEWQKCLGGSKDDYANSVQQTFDGGYIIAGKSLSLNGDVSGHHGSSVTFDYWVVKLNADGSLQWQNSLGGTNSDNASSIQQTSDSGFIVAGTSISNDGDVSGNHGYFDYWIVKLDVDGNLVWQKSLGGIDDDEATSIQQTSDGGFIVAGFSSSNGGDVSGHHATSSTYDYWIVRLDPDGNIIWQKSLGGNKNDFAYSIQQTSDAGFIVAGYSESNGGNVSGNHGDEDYWIVKLNAGGNIEWQRSLGGSADDEAFAIRETSDEGFVVAGYSFSNDNDVSGNHGDNDYWVVKLNAGGNPEWQESLGGSGPEYANSIEETSDGGFVVAGYSYSNNGDVSGNHGSYDYWIVKLDVFGNLVWQECLGGSSSDFAFAIRQTNEGGFIIAGRSDSNNGDVSGSNGNDDYWIVKLAPDIQPCSEPLNLFVNNITGTTAELHWTIQGSPSEFRVAYKSANTDYTIETIPGNTSSLTISGLTPNTLYAWGVKAICNAESVSNIEHGNRFSTSTEKLGVSHNLTGSLQVYPNPTNGKFTIELKADHASFNTASLEIINLLGQVVYTQKAIVIDEGLTNEINLDSPLADGVYYLKLNVGENAFAKSILLRKD